MSLFNIGIFGISEARCQQLINIAIQASEKRMNAGFQVYVKQVQDQFVKIKADFTPVATGIAAIQLDFGPIKDGIVALTATNADLTKKLADALAAAGVEIDPETQALMDQSLADGNAVVASADALAGSLAPVKDAADALVASLTPPIPPHTGD